MDDKNNALKMSLTAGRHLLVSTALLLALSNGEVCYAQNAYDGNKESSTEGGGSSSGTTDSPKTIDELTGISISKSNFKDFISVGNGGSNSTVDGTANQRVFVLYNVGAKKFLTSGTFWGRHAALSDKPQLFWFQRRNEVMGTHNQPLRYPTCEEDAIKLEGSATSYGTYFFNKDFSTMYFGSQEGNGRSQSTYNSIRILKSDGSLKKNLLSDIQSDGTGAVFADNGYSPNGSKFKSNTPLSELKLSEGDALEFQITLPSTDNRTNQSLLSVGQDIASWFGEEELANLHIYYLLGSNSNKKKIEVDFTRGKWDASQGKTVQVQQDQFRTLRTFETGKEVTIRITQTGITVGDELILAASNGKFTASCPTKPTKEQEVPGTEPYDTYLKYMKTKAGDIIKFKTDANGNFVLDGDGNMQVATEDDIAQGRWNEWRTSQKAYIYVDEDLEDDNASLFITQKIIKEEGSYENVDKFLSFAHDPNLTIEGSTGIYTDRAINSYTSGFGARNYGQWEFVPVEGQTGIYKLALYMKNELDGSATNTEKTYYLTGTASFLHGATTPENPQAYYYHQMDENGKWTQLEESTSKSVTEYTSADLSENCNDDFSSWKILTQQEFAKLENNNQEELLEPVDVTYLVSDPGFSRKSGGLKAWHTKDGNLENGNTAYNQATIRFGYEGMYKTKTTDTEYHSGVNCNYDSGDTKDYSKDNLYNSTHAQYMCASIQNGGYGKIYQQVPIYKKGWYILSCQGMSTAGAKLYIKVADDDETTQSYQLAQISQSFYQNYLACEDASKVYWPLDAKKPMYNAGVWMNDLKVEADQANIERYKNQVSIYIPALDDHTSEGYSYQYKTIEIGIEVPNPNGNTSSANTRAASTPTDFTAFDSFQLFYSGDDPDSEDGKPKLLLNENFTNMDYLDQTKETYTDAELHLNRTFSAKEWNTLVLPVSLTKEQFDGAFGGDSNNAKLIKIDRIDGKRLVFVPETEESAGGAYLRANKPYLIWTEKAQGDFGKEYSELLNKKDPTQSDNDNGTATQTQTQITVSVPRNHFTIAGVTLEKNNSAQDGYDFAGQFHKTLYGNSCLYVVGGEKVAGDGENVAYDKTDGVENKSRYATFYGTLCKTYDYNENGVNAFLPSRPLLNDGKSFYMKPGGGDNFYYRKAGSGYGLKGFRCWFVYEDETETSGAAAAKQFAIDINGVTDDVTDISNIERNDGAEIADQYANGIFNLNGQKVAEGKKISELPAGIYIVNGKKYIVNK